MNALAKIYWCPFCQKFYYAFEENNCPICSSVDGDIWDKVLVDYPEEKELNFDQTER